MSNPRKTATKRKPANSYKRPEPIPPGEILKDVGKKSWQLGPSIGAGGFGDIYSAAEVTESTKKKSAQFPFVVKIEPHDNGPLFVEMHFYMRVCREDDMSAWTARHKLSVLGIPRLLGWGSHDVRQVKHRFLVMDRFGADVWSLFVQNGRHMPAVTAARIAEQVLSVLEYIHSKGYVHADVKGANLLLSAVDAGRVVLVDFGMSCPASAKPDPKRAHNGTPEYASRDAHTGAMTLRGDLETLCLNVVQWSAGRLPWETRLDDLPALHTEKQKHLAAPDAALLSAFCTAQSGPAWLSDWLRHLASLAVAAAPDYASLRRVVRAAPGFTERGALEFAVAATKAVAVKTAAKTRRNEATADDAEGASPPKRGRPRSGASGAQNGHSPDQDSPPDQAPRAKRAASRKAAPALAAPSWRDGAAVSASNVARPGEYQRVAK